MTTINIAALAAKAAQQVEKAYETGGQAAITAVKKLRKIPDEVYDEILDKISQTMPNKISNLPDEVRGLQTQGYIVPRMIILMSEKQFFIDEIEARLGFNSDAAKETFSDYKTEAREIKRGQIAADVFNGIIDRSMVIPSPDPNNQEAVPFGEKLFESLSKKLFSRQTEFEFSIPITHKKKGGEKLKTNATEIFGDSQEWEKIRNIAAAKYKAAFPSKSGEKTAKSRPTKTGGGYMSSVIAEML